MNAFDEDGPRERRARAINSLVYGIGQMVLAVLVVIAAYELRPAAAQAPRVRAVIAALVAFAVYALIRGVRETRAGRAALRRLRSPDDA